FGVGANRFVVFLGGHGGLALAAEAVELGAAFLVLLLLLVQFRELLLFGGPLLLFEFRLLATAFLGGPGSGTLQVVALFLHLGVAAALLLGREAGLVRTLHRVSSLRQIAVNGVARS